MRLWLETVDASADFYLWVGPTHHVGTTAAQTPEKDPGVESEANPLSSGKCSPARWEPEVRSPALGVRRRKRAQAQAFAGARRMS